MCSIMAYCLKASRTTQASESDLEYIQSAKEVFERGFEKTLSRGPDESVTVLTQMGLLGFHRLAIMGLSPEGMQPFRLGESYVVCNGEIYGFEKIKRELEEKYTFISESDCEILLPMYEKYGTAMFEQLDAEFALVIFDGKNGKYIAARDPIGIRPLYYGVDAAGTMVFASEAKNLVDIVDEIKPFPPGYYCVDGEFHCYCDITKVVEYNKDDLESVCNCIREKLVAGIEKRLVADAKVGFLLSGGLDSSLVCAVAAKKSQTPIKTFAIGMSEDAIDLKYAKQVADYIGSEHTEVIIDKNEVLESLEEVVSILGTYDITTIRASMGMYLLCRAIHKQSDVKVLLTGEISDEIFGYKYTDFAPNAEAFQTEAAKRVHELHMYDVLRADRCISANSLEARVPFGDLDFVHYVMSIAPEMKLNKYGKGKYLLRHAFEEGGYLPDEIIWREKAAFSDAVGHSMVDYLKEYANDLYGDEEFRSLCCKYEHAKPFTKESLLYRELFEKYYPNQSQMVVDFWMPNKEWEGCDVDDPSARVLANYGDSGK